MRSPDALTPRDSRDCSRGTIESYPSLNEAVACVDKLSVVVLLCCVLMQGYALRPQCVSDVSCAQVVDFAGDNKVSHAR